MWGPTLAASLILVGTLIDKIRIYVASYSVDYINSPVSIFDHSLHLVPGFQSPDIFDVLIVIGGLSGGIFMLSLAAKLFPIFSLWEISEGIKIRAVKPYLRTKLLILGKPE